MLVAWVGGRAATIVDNLADDQIIECIGHMVRYTKTCANDQIIECIWHMIRYTNTCTSDKIIERIGDMIRYTNTCTSDQIIECIYWTYDQVHKHMCKWSDHRMYWTYDLVPKHMFKWSNHIIEWLNIWSGTIKIMQIFEWQLLGSSISVESWFSGVWDIWESYLEYRGRFSEKLSAVNFFKHTLTYVNE